MRPSEIPPEIVSIGHFLTRSEAAHLLGVPARTLLSMDNLLRLGGRVAIQEVYPGFQFRNREAFEAFREVVHRFGHTDPWLVLGWLNRRRTEFGGHSAVEWLHEGRDVSKVLQLAERAAD